MGLQFKRDTPGTIQLSSNRSSVEIGVTLYDDSGAVPLSIFITEGTYTIQRERDGSYRTVVPATASDKGDGEVYTNYVFSRAMWQDGDTAIVTFTGIQYAGTSLPPIKCKVYMTKEKAISDSLETASSKIDTVSDSVSSLSDESAADIPALLTELLSKMAVIEGVVAALNRTNKRS